MNYCSECGSKVVKKEVHGNEEDYCEECDTIHWKNPAPFAGVIVRRGEEVLMIKRGIDPYKDTWSIPAGYMDLNEDPSEAAVRELEEETGVEKKPGELDIADSVHLTHPDGKQVIGIIFETEIDHDPELASDHEIQKAEFRTNVEEQSPLLDELEEKIFNRN